MKAGKHESCAMINSVQVSFKFKLKIEFFLKMLLLFFQIWQSDVQKRHREKLMFNEQAGVCIDLFLSAPSRSGLIQGKLHKKRHMSYMIVFYIFTINWGVQRFFFDLGR